MSDIFSNGILDSSICSGPCNEALTNLVTQQFGKDISVFLSNYVRCCQPTHKPFWFTRCQWHFHFREMLERNKNMYISQVKIFNNVNCFMYSASKKAFSSFFYLNDWPKSKSTREQYSVCNLSHFYLLSYFSKYNYYIFKSISKVIILPILFKGM